MVALPPRRRFKGERRSGLASFRRDDLLRYVAEIRSHDVRRSTERVQDLPRSRHKRDCVACTECADDIPRVCRYKPQTIDGKSA